MKKIITSFLVVAATSTVSFGQTIVTDTVQLRSIVLEEYTGLHCTFCPDGHVKANAIAAEYPGRTVLINVHTGGYATPAAGEPDMQTAFGPDLANQTNLTGYPSGTVNRHVFPALSSSTALNRGDWAGVSPEILEMISPVNTGATSTYNASTNELTIEVEAYYTSNSATSTNFLNVVLLQDSILGPQTGGTTYNPDNYVGGLYSHNHVLRHMITGQWGDQISTTTAGSLFSNTYTYTVPADINGLPVDIANCHIAVFITETQQEVLTGIVMEADGGSDMGNNAPSIGEFNNLTVAAQSGSNGATNSFSFDISPVIPGATSDYNFTLTTDAPGDWNGSYSVDGTPYSGPQTLTLGNSTLAAITIDVDPGASPAVSEYTLTMTLATNSNAVLEQSVYVISGITDLIINGSGSNGAGNGNGAIDYEQEFLDGLDAAGNTTNAASEANVMNILNNASILGDVNNIYLNIGWTFPSFSDEDIASLSAFMDAGGNVFMAGQDIAWDILSGDGYGTPAAIAFMANYMNTQYVADGGTSNSQLTAVATDVFFGGVPNSSIVDVYSGNMYPDELTPINGAEAIFNYNGNPSKVGGIRYNNGTAKMVYIGVGLEMIGNSTIKDQIVSISHDYFYGLLSDDQVDFNSLFEVYPNPTSGILNIKFENISKSNFQITNIMGEIIESGTLNGSTGIQSVDVSNLAEGNYSISLICNENYKSLQFVIIK